MKEEIVDKLREVESKLQNGESLEREDTVFLFGLSLLRDKENE